jgi:hypothetical protein
VSEETKPALTSAQWEAALRSGFQRTSMLHELLTALLRGDQIVGIHTDEPFGFTRADARALLQAARHLEHGGFRADAARFTSIAERFAALRPPEEP